MQFEPMGGFPPIIREEDAKPTKEALELRGFATTDIVSIDKIMSAKKKGPLFIAFGDEEETGLGRIPENSESQHNIKFGNQADFIINNLLFDQPYEYQHFLSSQLSENKTIDSERLDITKNKSKKSKKLNKKTRSNNRSNNRSKNRSKNGSKSKSKSKSRNNSKNRSKNRFK